MNKSVLLVALLLAPLSGCLGIPEGAIAPGDTVQVSYSVYDADSGELLINNQATSFVVGQGNAGLGFEFERSLIAKSGDFVGTLIVRNDPSIQWSETVSVQARFESDLVQTIPLNQFTQSFGEPVPGETFSPQFSFFDYLVLDVDGDVVAYRPVPEQGQRDPVPAVGAILVTSVEDDMLVQFLEPDVGTTFRILPPSPFNPSTPLGLEPGSYRTVSGDGETITYEHGQGTNPDIIGHDLRIEVTVTSLRKSTEPSSVEPMNGNYGVRQSPVINGAPSAIVDFGAHTDAAMDHADDGHDH